MSRLVHKSFLQYDQASDHYQMHELLRQYGAEKLAQDPVQESEVRDQHSGYFCRWLHEQGAGLQSAKQQAALDEIEAEIENVRTACNWAASQGQAERAVEVYALAARHPLVVNSRWFKEVAGREIASVAAQLPSQAVQATRARGQAADLWQAAVELLEL